MAARASHGERSAWRGPDTSTMAKPVPARKVVQSSQAGPEEVWTRRAEFEAA